MMSELVTIDIPTTEPEGRGRYLLATVAGADGQPVAGASVHFRVDGHGSFNPSQHMAAVEIPTNKGGQAMASWWEYPRYQPRRDLRSEVSASCDVPDCIIKLLDLHASGGLRTRHTSN